MLKKIDAVMTEWYTLNGLTLENDLCDENEEKALVYAAEKLGMTEQEIIEYLE